MNTNQQENFSNNYDKQQKNKFLIKSILTFLGTVLVSLLISYLVYAILGDKYETLQVIIIVGGIGSAVIGLFRSLVEYFRF